MPMQTIYLAYGSNLNFPQMARRCPTAKIISTTELPGYELLFRGDDGHAVATVEPGGGVVPALLWRLRPQDEKNLDVYEGWPHFYRKETVEVELGGKVVAAMVYIMNDGHALGNPSMRYFKTILDGYDAAGFDDAVLFDALERSQPEMNPVRDQAQQYEMDW